MAGLARQLDRSAHHLTELLCDAETEPGTAVASCRRAVGLSKSFKDMALLVGCYSDAGVGDAEGDAGRLGVGFDRVDADFDLASRGKFHRVGDQVGQDLAQAPGIADQCRRQIHRDRAAQLQPLAVSQVGKGFGDVFDDVAQIERRLLEFDLSGFDLGDIEDLVDDPEQYFGRALRGCDVAVLLLVEPGLTHQLQHAENAIHRGADFVAHLGQELRLGAVGLRQFESPPLDPRFERRIQMAQSLLGPLLCRIPNCERVGHVVERQPETADLRVGIIDVDAGLVIALAPFGGALQQLGDRSLDEPAAAEPGEVHCRNETEQDQHQAAFGGGIDRLERVGFLLARAEEKTLRRERDGHVSENSHHAVDAGRLVPSGRVAIHDVFMRLPHVLADQLLAIR